eukprot:754146-Hanusia_phi.AAC.2
MVQGGDLSGEVGEPLLELVVLGRPGQHLIPREEVRELFQPILALLLGLVPPRFLSLQQRLVQVPNLELQLCCAHEEEQDLFRVGPGANDVPELLVLAVPVQHRPANGGVGVPEAVEDLVPLVQDELLHQDAFGKVLAQLPQLLLHPLELCPVNLLDQLRLRRVLEGRRRGLVRLPHDAKVNHKAHVEGDHLEVRSDLQSKSAIVTKTALVVREMFINDLSHCRKLLVEDVWNKEENYVQNRCLGCQGSTTVLGVGPFLHLAVDIIRSQSIDHHPSDGYRRSKPSKEVLWVPRRSLLRGREVPGAAEHVAYGAVAVRGALVPVVADEHALSDRTFDPVVHQSEHEAVQVVGLRQELLAAVACKDILDPVLDVHALLHVLEVPGQVLDVLVHRLEELEEPLQELDMALPKLFVEVDQDGIRIDSVFVELHAPQVREVVQERAILGLICLVGKVED